MSKTRKRYLFLAATLTVMIAVFASWLAYSLHEDPYRFRMPSILVGDFGGTGVGSR